MRGIKPMPIKTGGVQPSSVFSNSSLPRMQAPPIVAVAPPAPPAEEPTPEVVPMPEPMPEPMPMPPVAIKAKTAKPKAEPKAEPAPVIDTPVTP